LCSLLKRNPSTHSNTVTFRYARQRVCEHQWMRSERFQTACDIASPCLCRHVALHALWIAESASACLAWLSDGLDRVPWCKSTSHERRTNPACATSCFRWHRSQLQWQERSSGFRITCGLNQNRYGNICSCAAGVFVRLYIKFMQLVPVSTAWPTTALSTNNKYASNQATGCHLHYNT
jgi:hypothetical protein